MGAERQHLPEAILNLPTRCSRALMLLGPRRSTTGSDSEPSAARTQLLPLLQRHNGHADLKFLSGPKFHLWQELIPLPPLSGHLSSLRVRGGGSAAQAKGQRTAPRLKSSNADGPQSGPFSFFGGTTRLAPAAVLRLYVSRELPPARPRWAGPKSAASPVRGRV